MSASVTIGFDRSRTSRPGGTRVKMASTGRTRNASATAAAPTKRTPRSVCRERRPATLGLRLDARQEAVAAQDPLAPRAEDLLDERVGRGPVPARRDDADPVLHVRLRPGGK